MTTGGNVRAAMDRGPSLFTGGGTGIDLSKASRRASSERPRTFLNPYLQRLLHAAWVPGDDRQAAELEDAHGQSVQLPLHRLQHRGAMPNWVAWPRERDGGQ